MAYGKRRSRTTLGKRSRTRRTRKPAARKVRRLARAVVSRVAEKKDAHTGHTASYNSGANTGLDVQVLVPSIPQGYTNGHRIGEKVTLCSFNLKGVLKMFLNTGSAQSCRIMMRMVVLLSKRYKDAIGVYNNSANWIDKIIQVGSASQGMDGGIEGLLYPFNKDEVTVLAHKRFSMSQGNVQVSGTSHAYSQDTANSFKFINMNFKVKNKVLKYTRSETYPTNWAPVLLVSYYKTDGLADVTDTRLQFAYGVSMTYTDM